MHTRAPGYGPNAPGQGTWPGPGTWTSQRPCTDHPEIYSCPTTIEVDLPEEPDTDEAEAEAAIPL